MGEIAFAMASSHAFTFREPSEWDGYRALIAAGYERRYQKKPIENPGVVRESVDENESRYATIRDGIHRLRQQLSSEPPSAFVLIGDDQNENFSPDFLLPQIAVYTGGDFRVTHHGEERSRVYPVHAELANAIVSRGIDEEFDIAMCAGFSDGRLKSHAHYEILEHVLGALDVPVVLIFINALHMPSISPARCFAFGEMLGRAISGLPAGERIAIYGSGGLSHFTGGFPWRSYDGPFRFGDISRDFDLEFIEWLKQGSGSRAKGLTSQQLLHHGEIELRSWIAVLGAIGAARADFAIYEPFYRGMMGMAVASWRLAGTQRAALGGQRG